MFLGFYCMGEICLGGICPVVFGLRSFKSGEFCPGASDLEPKFVYVSKKQPVFARIIDQ